MGAACVLQHLQVQWKCYLSDCCTRVHMQGHEVQVQALHALCNIGKLNKKTCDIV